MKLSHWVGWLLACFSAITSTNLYASVIVYDFTGTVIDPGIIAGVTASLDDPVIGKFAYDTSTLDSDSDPDRGEYIDFAISPPVMITLPDGSITFNSFTSVFVTVDTEINIASGTPDPTVSGNNIDHDIIFSRKPSSTALSTDALPTTIDVNDFDSIIGAFSSFSITNGPAGDPIFYSLDTLIVNTVVTGTSGDDVLLVDLSNGTYALNNATPIVFGGSDLIFNAGGQSTSGDSMRLVGDSVATSSFNFINENDGSVDVNGQLITYTGLEPIEFELDVDHLVFDYRENGVDTIVLSDNGISADGVSTIDSTAGELVNFRTGNTSIIEILLGADDIFSNIGLDSLFSGRLIVSRVSAPGIPTIAPIALLTVGFAGIGYVRRKAAAGQTQP